MRNAAVRGEGSAVCGIQPCGVRGGQRTRVGADIVVRIERILNGEELGSVGIVPTAIPLVEEGSAFVEGDPDPLVIEAQAEDLKRGELRAGCRWYGAVWVCGVVVCGGVWWWCGVVWCGVVWCGVVWCGAVWFGVVAYDGTYY